MNRFGREKKKRGQAYSSIKHLFTNIVGSQFLIKRIKSFG